MFVWEYEIPTDFVTENTNRFVSLNPYTLSFYGSLENDFLNQYSKDSLVQTNIALVLGALFYSSFIFLDWFLVPEYILIFLSVRLGLVWTTIFVLIVIINKSKLKALWQPLVAFGAILIAITLIFFQIVAAPALNSSYYIGMIIIYFWSYSFLRLRYIWATTAGLTVFTLYMLSAIYIIDLDFKSLVVSASFLLGSNFVGMIIAYVFEYYSRNNFFQNLILKNSLEANISLNHRITESHRTIIQAEERLLLQSKALESAANSIVILDRDGIIIWCNSAFLNLTGFSLEETIGKGLSILKSGKHDKVFYKNIWSTILSGRVWSGEIINKKKNGDLYFEEMIITPVIDKETKKISHFIAIKQDITLRKDMEDELFESEKRFRTLFENATMGLYRSSLSGDILMANKALINMLGFDSLEDLRNRNLTTAGYVNPTQRDEFVKKLEERGNLIGFESEWRRKDGSTIFIRESSRLDYDGNGEVFYEGTVEDITLSKLAEAELRESEDRLRTVFDNLNDAIIIHDSTGKIVEVNNKVLDLYNISMESVLNLTIIELSSQDNTYDLLLDNWNKVIKQNKTFRFEWKAMRPTDKYVFDVEVFLSKISLGNEDLILANIRDITEQKIANKNLLLFQNAVEMNAAPIYWLTTKAEIIYVNNAAIKMLNYSLNEFIKMKIPDIDPLWSQDYWDTVGYPRLKKKRTDIFETFHKTKLGEEIPIEVSSSIIDFEGEEIIVALVSDMTERKIAAQNLLDAKEKAEKSDRLKSEFLAGMSHEIRTPINTVLNFISLIRNDLGNSVSEEVKSSFEMIDSGSRRLIRTIDAILNMSQLQTGTYDLKLESFSLVEDILLQLMDEFRPAAKKKGLDFKLKVNCKNTHVFADHYTISQLMINLIENAIKYTNSGYVEVSIKSSNEHIIIEIIDTGIGISEDFLPTLFDPFVQEEMGYTRSFEGNGLGLALVKRYVELNQGIIEVSSSKGKGSNFKIKLKSSNPS